MKNNRPIASPVLRLLSNLIDGSITLMPMVLIAVSISSSTEITGFLNRASLLAVFLIYPIFNTLLSSLMISTFGGTFGKLLTGTEIVDTDGNYLSFWNATWRNLIGYTVSGLLLWSGFIWILIDKERQGWHDMMAGSYVVVKNKWLAILGLAILGLILFVQLSLIKTSVNNFKSNTPFYAEIYTELQAETKNEASS